VVTGEVMLDRRGRLVPGGTGIELRRPVNLALWMTAGAVLAGWLALAAIHVRDDYRVTHVQGVWIAAVEAARAGRLYPPLFDGEHYAGTRYMPMPILLNAVASAAAGDPLTGGKVLAAILMGTLLALVVSVLRRFSCPWPVAIALSAAVVATETGLQAGTTIGGDLLPVVLQVGAVAVTLRRRRPSMMLIAGGLAGLAAASKLTGFWAFFAITTWLMAQRQWRPAAIFVAGSAAAAGAVLGTVQLLTAGGLSQHLLAFSAAGVQGGGALFRAPNQILYNLLAFAPATVVLLPLAALGALLTAGWRQLSPIDFAVGYALLLLLGVYTDVGTGFNQLLDLAVLTSLAVGHLAGRAATGDTRVHASLLLAVAVAVVWAAGLGMVRTVGFDLRRTAAAMSAGGAAPRAAAVIADLVRPDEQVLAEDPAISVALGRQPLIMDAFMLARLDRSHPDWVDPLIARISARRFGLVVLVVALEDRSLDFWWTDYHLGPRVANALRSSYRFDRSVGRYYLYRPMPGVAARP
jgi:hypothetical protein